MEGIRTLETLPSAPLAGVCLRPLGHHSADPFKGKALRGQGERWGILGVSEGKAWQKQRAPVVADALCLKMAGYSGSEDLGHLHHAALGHRFHGGIGQRQRDQAIFA